MKRRKTDTGMVLGSLCFGTGVNHSKTRYWTGDHVGIYSISSHWEQEWRRCSDDLEGFVSRCLGIKGVLNLFEPLYAHGTDKSPENTSEYCFAGWKQCLFNCLFCFGHSYGWGWRRRIKEFCRCLVSNLYSVKQSLKLFCCSLWLKRGKGLSTWASNFF